MSLLGIDILVNTVTKNVRVDAKASCLETLQFVKNYVKVLVLLSKLALLAMNRKCGSHV